MHTFCDIWHQLKDHKKTFDVLLGKFHDQGDAKRIVIRGQLKGHFRWPTPGRPIGRLVVGFPQGVFGGLSYYWLIICFFNLVPLIMEFTSEVTKHNKNVTKKGVLRFSSGDKTLTNLFPYHHLPIWSNFTDIVHDTQYLAKSSQIWGNNVISSNHYNNITISSQYHYNIIATSYSKLQVNKLVKMIMFHESAMTSQADTPRQALPF
jgi:hypothetical protein